MGTTAGRSGNLLRRLAAGLLAPLLLVGGLALAHGLVGGLRFGARLHPVIGAHPKRAGGATGGG